jgi:hypothetical protein
MVSQFTEIYTTDHPDIALSNILHRDYPRVAIIGKRANLEHVQSNVENGYAVEAHSPQEEISSIAWYHKLEDTKRSPHMLLIDVDKSPNLRFSGYKLYSILTTDFGRGSHIMKTFQNGVVNQLMEG